MIDHDVRTDPAITPITVLTGFLGAGKTTLLNRILNGDHGLRIAVMVNDFGSINIDADLVLGIEADGDIINLANGCICCSLRDDMLTAVEQITERPEQPQYIIVEASGVADPSRIAFTFINASLRGRVRLDSILCLVDASQVFAVPEQMELKTRQIAYSDMLILSKTDLVSRAEVGRIRAWLDDGIGRYRLVERPTARCRWKSCSPADASIPRRWRLRACSPTNAPAPAAITKATTTIPRPLAPGASRLTVLWRWRRCAPQPRNFQPSIYRAKGVVYSSDVPDRRVVLQVVGKRVDISLQDEWGARPRLTRIVAIGSAEGVDANALQDRFEQCCSV